MENGNLDLLQLGNEARKLLLLFIFFSTSSMKPVSVEYKVISTEECIKHILQSGSNIENNNWDYNIRSGKGLIYTLSNGEFVLIPTNLDGSYPGIIFNSKESFMKYFAIDSFPIDVKHMTWLEAHSFEMKKFLVDDTFYNSVLDKELGVKLPLTANEDFKSAYTSLISYLKTSSKGKEDKLASINCYGLAVTEYLIKIGGNRWELRKQYEMYNPYYYPVIITDRAVIDVISKLHIAIQSNSPNSFDLFCGFVGL